MFTRDLPSILDLFCSSSSTPTWISFPGLALFGDNAYVSTDFMVTPYKNVRAGLKDNLNFYQSQVRISIECAFGKLVHRWAILRRALSSKMGVRKQIEFTVALCKLHNFCIGEDDTARTTQRKLGSLLSSPPTSCW